MGRSRGGLTTKAHVATDVGAPIGTTGGVQQTTQALADQFAAGIAAHPADWHMLQPLWTADQPIHAQAR